MNSKSKLRKNVNKENLTASYIGVKEEDVFEKYPNAQKISKDYYCARNGEYTVWIAYDSIMNGWRVFGRTKDDPSIWKKFMDNLISLFN